MLVASLFMGGCWRATYSQPVPPPVTLVATDGFTLYADNADGTVPIARCRVTRVDATVDEVRGDTLVLRSVRVRAQAAGTSACPTSHRIMVNTAVDSSVRTELRRADPVRSVLIYLISAVGIAVIVGL